jgi:hypothetical protein
MIRLQLHIRNIFYDITEGYKSYFDIEKPVSKHKMFEINIYRHFYHLFNFELDLRFNGYDHAGPNLGLCIFGYGIFMQLYDTRHWNIEEKRWYRSDETIEDYL